MPPASRAAESKAINPSTVSLETEIIIFDPAGVRVIIKISRATSPDINSFISGLY